MTAALVTMAGCSSTSAPKKEAAAKKPVEPVTGQSGIFQMYQVARTWAKDAMLLKVDNLDIAEAKSQPGKYGAWRGVFVSLEKNQKREYMFSVADSEGGIIKGARAGAESLYIRNPQVRPIAIQDVKIDTPAALEEALKNKEVKEFADKNPNEPVQFILEWTGQTPVACWRVFWGPTVSTAKANVYIDCKTGKFVKKTR
ncbi:MAG: hypothetical protein HXY18_16420 [Bryobacteraceae bacterium]|nr:hypothetical protein [Bryobacteraceae bacterium]